MHEKSISLKVRPTCTKPISLKPVQARRFWHSKVQGTPSASFEISVPIGLTLYYLIFLKAYPKFDHMTHFGFHGNRLSVLRWLKSLFLQKPLTKDTAQMALFLVYNESANTKIALCI